MQDIIQERYLCRKCGRSYFPDTVFHHPLEQVNGYALVLPVVTSWLTDPRAFRQAGTPAYGFIPVLLEQDDYASIHGHNERISLENVRLGTQVLFALVRRTAT